MSFGGSFLKIVSIGLFVASNIVAPGSGLATGLFIGGLVAGTLGGLIDKQKIPEQRQQIGMSLDPGAPLPVVYGRAKVGSIVADWFIDPDTDAKILYEIVALCHGSRDAAGIEAIEEIWLDGRKAVVNPTSGELAESGGNDVREHPYVLNGLDFKLFLGTANQTIGFTDLSGLFTAAGTKSPSDVTDSGWDAITDLGDGIAAMSLRMSNLELYVVAGGGNDKKKQYIYSGPPAVTAIVRGNFVEDPRAQVSGVNITFTNVGTADTITRASGSFVTDGYATGDRVAVSGASLNNGLFTIATVAATVLTLVAANSLTNEGPSAGITLKRWASPSNGGDNPALCVRDYLLSTIYGWGLTASLIDETSFATAADYCDELIDYPLTAGNDNTTRLTCNGVLDTGKTLQSNLEELLSSCRGALDWSGGTARLLIRSETGPAAVLALSPANIVGQWSFRNAGNIDRWNLVTASYVDPLNGEFKAAQTQWPPLGANAYLTADNDFLNRLDLSLPFTNDGAMAQMIAQIMLNESRSGISCSVRCTEEALQVSVGDLVTVTHDTPGWDVKPFWVQRMELLPDTNVVLTLSEYEPDAYDLSTMEDRRTYAATTHQVATLPDPDAEVSNNLIRNGDFEIGLSNWIDVSTAIGGGSIVLDTSTPYKGAASLQLSYGGGGTIETRQCLEDHVSLRYVRVLIGTTLNFSAAGKCSAGGTHFGNVYVDAYDDLFALVSSTSVLQWSVADTAWTVKTNTFVMPAGTYYINLRLDGNGTGIGRSAYFDEIHIS